MHLHQGKEKEEKLAFGLGLGEKYLTRQQKTCLSRYLTLMNECW